MTSPVSQKPADGPPAPKSDNHKSHKSSSRLRSPCNSLYVQLPPPFNDAGEPNSVCPACQAILASPTSLDRHMTRHHHPKRVKRITTKVGESKVGKALYSPFKPRPRYGQPILH
ncbi:hypothetical protein JCM8547_003656 [Rhodosporidiobolus lusitaniae]